MYKMYLYTMMYVALYRTKIVALPNWIVMSQNLCSFMTFVDNLFGRHTYTNRVPMCRNKKKKGYAKSD